MYSLARGGGVVNTHVTRILGALSEIVLIKCSPCLTRRKQVAAAVITHMLISKRLV